MGALTPPPPPYLWGEWRCTDDPRTFIAPCPVCGALLIINRRGFDEWRAACSNGCTREAIDAAAAVLADEQERRRAPMDPDDPFYGIDADRYITLLTGREVKRHFAQCPFHGDGNERTPSLHANGPLWYCHGCGKGGSIYDFGAELWGIEPRAGGFRELQQRLALGLRQGAPL